MQDTQPLEGWLVTQVGMDAVEQTLKKIKACESAPSPQTEVSGLTTSKRMSGAQRLRRQKERQDVENMPSIEAAFAGAAASRATPSSLHLVLSLPQIDAFPPSMGDVSDEEALDVE